MNKVFLDTNIILDLIQCREDYALAARIFQGALDGRCEIITSTLSMVNVAYILRKVYKGEELYQHLRTMRTLLGVVPVTTDAYDKALNSNAKDFEDAVQLYSADEAKAFCIVTRNKKDFIADIINVLTPQEFIDSYFL